MTLPFDPSQLEALKRDDPAAYDDLVTRLALNLSPDEVKLGLLSQLAARAQKETLDGFEAYYEGIHGNKLLPHNVDAARECFQSFEDGEIFLYQAARGFRKTSTFDVTMGSWLLGLHPDMTGMVTGANDPNAKLIAKSIAQIIEYHPFFKMTFPHVVIDKDRGWGAEGYWIRDNRMTIEQWVEQQAKINDPSFVGGGYKSSEINGKHPSLFLLVDDLHDIDSSRSETEREAIKSIFLTQILKTVLRAKDKLLTKVIMTGVPFAKNDTYAVLKDAGGTRYVKTPAMVRAPEGEGVYIDGVNPKTGAVYEDIVGWWHLTCDEILGAKGIVNARSEGKSSFWQMMMLDINTAKQAGLKYYSFDHTKIGFELPTVGGADPTGIDPDSEVGGNKTSSFALAYVCKLPQGGAVIKDGVLKPMGIFAAKNAILQAQGMFKNWITTAVEDVGVGKIFLQYLRQDSRVHALPSNLKDVKTGRINNKLLRFQNEVHPHIESGLVRISDEDTPFLNALRWGMDNFYDLDPKKPHESLDAFDSVYHALKFIPEVLRTVAEEDISPRSLGNRGGLWHPLWGAREGVVNA